MGDIKKRSFPYQGPNSWDTTMVSGFSGTDYTGAHPIRHSNMSAYWKPWIGTQVTESENHAGWEKGYTLGLGDIPVYHPDRGGDFTTQRSYVESPSFAEAQTVDSGWYSPYTGARYNLRDRRSAAILPLFPSQMPFPPSGRSDESTLSAYGTTAIARCAPRNNVAQLAVALLEGYHDGIPKILGAASWAARSGRLKDVVRSSGDEYLNVQFGWKPLLSDIHDFLHGVTNLSTVYDNYAKNAGKAVRRRYDFPPTKTTTVSTVATNTGPGVITDVDYTSTYQDGRAGRGTVYLSRETEKRQWFSGAFTYYIPPMGDSFVDHTNRAIESLGLDLDPETLWNIAPWSWAVDWFTNVGDLVHNVNSWSSDGLVLKYGYIMEHSLVRDHYTWVGDTRYLPGNIFPESVTLVTETKIRRRATPFGFGLSFSGFSNRRKAIAAALGLSRLR